MNNKTAQQTADTTKQRGISHFDTLPDSAFIRPGMLPAILGFSPSTLWRLVKAGKFPAPIKLSERVTAFPVAAVRTWINERTAAPSAA